MNHVEPNKPNIFTKDTHIIDITSTTVQENAETSGNKSPYYALAGLPIGPTVWTPGTDFLTYSCTMSERLQFASLHRLRLGTLSQGSAIELEVFKDEGARLGDVHHKNLMYIESKAQEIGIFGCINICCGC